MKYILSQEEYEILQTELQELREWKKEHDLISGAPDEVLQYPDMSADCDYEESGKALDSDAFKVMLTCSECGIELDLSRTNGVIDIIDLRTTGARYTFDRPYRYLHVGCAHPIAIEIIKQVSAPVKGEMFTNKTFSSGGTK